MVAAVYRHGNWISVGGRQTQELLQGIGGDVNTNACGGQSFSEEKGGDSRQINITSHSPVGGREEGSKAGPGHEKVQEDGREAWAEADKLTVFGEELMAS